MAFIWDNIVYSYVKKILLKEKVINEVGENAKS
jgi:hypothetical protein